MPVEIADHWFSNKGTKRTSTLSDGTHVGYLLHPKFAPMFIYKDMQYGLSEERFVVYIADKQTRKADKAKILNGFKKYKNYCAKIKKEKDNA